ncbi:MAG: hypothetical protein IPH88_09350 [Bacteroidales bacterium]|nr:hypothetical protein [Bacteroidales bacterium]
MNEPLLGFEDFKLFCYVNFKVPSEVTETYKDAFISKSFPYFKYMHTVIQYILNERELYIFKNNFGFLGDSQKRTLQSIGDHYGITRERVRQIAQKVPEKVYMSVNKIAQRFFNIDKQFNYDLDLKKEFLIVNDDLVKKINNREKLNFTGKFYALILAGTLQRYFIAFQDVENNYRNYYLISRKYRDVFNFKAFFADVETLMEDRIENDFQVDAMDYLGKFLLPGQTMNDRLKQICRRMLSDEFNLGFDKTKITFHRNTLVKLSEHILSILGDAGRPMKLTEICKELKNRTSRIPPNIESLRSSILSIEEVVAIGKTSTYALKDWQMVKTGTIKQLVKEYLDSSDEPKHILDITVYVNQYRVTSDKNILSNLKLDKTSTFVFFKKSFIGLKNKSYKTIPGGGDQGGRGRKPKL